MQSTIEELGPNRVRIVLDLVAAELEAYMAQRSAKPGEMGRPGSKQATGYERVRQAAHDAMADHWIEALRRYRLRVIGQPQITIAVLDRGDGVSYEFEATIWPQIPTPILSDLLIRLPRPTVVELDNSRARALRDGTLSALVGAADLTSVTVPHAEVQRRSSQLAAYMSRELWRDGVRLGPYASNHGMSLAELDRLCDAEAERDLLAEQLLGNVIDAEGIGVARADDIADEVSRLATLIATSPAELGRRLGNSGLQGAARDLCLSKAIQVVARQASAIDDHGKPLDATPVIPYLRIRPYSTIFQLL